MMKKYLLGFFLFALVAVPFSSQAMTVAELQAMIAQLQAQLSALQSSQAVPNCKLVRDLIVGDGEDDGLSSQVSFLQQKLITAGYLSVAKPTGWFGNMTRGALKQWQQANGLKVTGQIGPSEKALLCGGAVVTTDPVSQDKTPVATQSNPYSVNVGIKNVVQSQGTGNFSAFISTSIEAGSKNNTVASWGLTISCPSGVTVVVSGKNGEADKNLCETTQTYYSYNYPGINQGILVLGAGATNANSSQSYVGYSLIAYDNNGKIIGGDKDVVSLGIPNIPVIDSATYTSGKDTAFVSGSKLQNALVYFNGTVISKENYSVQTESRISFMLPTYISGSYPVYVKNSNGESNTVYLTI